MSTPEDDEAYQRFMESMTERCRCTPEGNRPCDGVLAGGLCDDEHPDLEIQPDDPDEDESQCGKPCSPDAPCDECAGYWQHMVSEGYWDRGSHRWTEKGWNSIVRSF